ncbi:MAG TPA: class IV adenylate cyclase [Terriglobales bacterium]|nr:class IV adenylate cyclase [Terriglobales bacterium]
MPANVEIKAILHNRMAAEAIAARLSDRAPETIEQEDVFFRCAGARLKLRILGPKQGELIRYARPDLAGIRSSQYVIARTTEPEALREILGQTLGVIGVVRKTRTLYQVGQTRIHLDRVAGLGNFLELEVVLRPEQTEAEGKTIAQAWLENFRIEDNQLVAVAYIDLLVSPTGSEQLLRSPSAWRLRLFDPGRRLKTRSRCRVQKLGSVRLTNRSVDFPAEGIQP